MSIQGMGATTETAMLFPRAEAESPDQAVLYERVNAEFAAPLARVASAHEADPSLRQDLLQEIHIAVWRSLSAFGGRCSLRTWIYRVAHNAAVSYVVRRQRGVAKHLVALDDVDVPSDDPGIETVIDDALMIARIRALLPQLKPLDREVFVLYLEGLSTDEIAEIAGLSLSNTGTKLHRIRALLMAQLGTGETR
jgi:RNA polymerase sigma-70 factor, ECF subfamily